MRVGLERRCRQVGYFYAKKFYLWKSAGKKTNERHKSLVLALNAQLVEVLRKISETNPLQRRKELTQKLGVTLAAIFIDSYVQEARRAKEGDPSFQKKALSQHILFIGVTLNRAHGCQVKEVG